MDTPRPDLDPVEALPTPDELRGQIRRAVRRKDLLKQLLRVSERKAAYDRAEVAPEGQPCES